MAGKPAYVTELEQKAAVHDIQIESVKELTETNRDRLDAVKSEHDKDIAALKAEVAILKLISLGAIGSFIAAALAFIFKK